MKMSLLLFTAGIFAMLDNGNNATSNWKVKTEYHLNKFRMEDSVYLRDGVTRTYTYLTERKLAGISLSNGNRFEFATGEKIDSTKTFDGNGKLLALDVWYKNKDGIVDSVVNYDSNGSIKSTQHFLFDSDGNKIESRNYEKTGFSFVAKKKFLNGLNISEELVFTPSIDTITILNPVTLKLDTVIKRVNNPSTIYYNDFYLNKLNTPEYVAYLKEHWGDGSVQLKKKSVQISTEGDTLDVEHYRYTFDEKNRVTSIVMETNWNKGNVAYDSTNYTYY